ncbi:hypothetical protein KR038_003916, partial [Drosophila bunnanda]
EQLEQLGEHEELDEEQDDGEEDEPWPDLVQLHQPPEHSQLLLAERASCIAVRTYLRLCRLPFAEKTSAHAEFMTQGGRLTGLPMLRLGQFQILAEFEPIVDHVAATRPSKALGRWLSEEQREDMRCMVNYVETVFTLAEIHLSYVDPVNYRLYTARRTGAGHPWVLSLLRRFYKQRQAMRLLRVYQWHHMNTDQVLEEVTECCEALMDQLEDHEVDSEGFLCGSQPCELDALVFGHVVGILNTPLPNRELAELLNTYPRLVAFCRRIDASLYGGKLLNERDDSGSDFEEDANEDNVEGQE